jgi:hypothetical protein
MNLEMKRALDLLNLGSIEALETRFLASPAFLEPWVSFRDSFLLLQKGGAPRTALPDQIDGRSLLYWYTLFDEGRVRYDERLDETSSVYEEDVDISMYGLIDKSTWGIVEYEKLLYVWLLQKWQVGKKRSTGGFAYFVYKNQVTAWREVFVPIVNALRQSYDIKGRRHYGRLARFVEGIAPSRLAFPENNVGVGVGPGFAIPPTTPYRLVSRPRMKGESSPSRSSVIKKKQYDDTEMELRDVYPQYGQLVERPKNMNVVKDFLETQRQKKELEKARRALEGTPEKSVSASLARRISTSSMFHRSSISRNKSHKNGGSSEYQGTVHGVERHFPVPGTPTKMVARSPIAYEEERGYGQRTISIESSKTMWPSHLTPQEGGCSSIGHTRLGFDDVFTSVRNSNTCDGSLDRQHDIDISSFGSESEADYPLTPTLLGQGNEEQATPTDREHASGSPSSPIAYGRQPRTRSKGSARGDNTLSIRPPSSLTAYLSQEMTIQEETPGSISPSHSPSPSDFDSGRIHPAHRGSPYTGQISISSSPSFQNACEESIHPSLRDNSRECMRSATRIPIPAAAYDGREYGAQYSEDLSPSTTLKAREHAPIAEFDEPQYSEREAIIRTNRPEVTRIPTTLYQYLGHEDTKEEQPFQLSAPQKASQQVSKAMCHADLSLSIEPPPPLPLKSPRRFNSVQGSRGTVSHTKQHHLVSTSSYNFVVPAVSIENIRAALGDPDRFSSEDEEEPQHQSRTTSGSGSINRHGIDHMEVHSGSVIRTWTRAIALRIQDQV